jgi:hypothetical protein
LDDAGIEPRPVATLALPVRRSNHSARSHVAKHFSKLKIIQFFKSYRTEKDVSRLTKNVSIFFNLKIFH